MYRSLRTLKAVTSTFAPLRASLRPTTLPRAALAPAPIASLVSKRFYADAGSPGGAKVKDGEGAKTGAQEQMRASSSAAAEIKGITSDVAGMISGKSKKAPNAVDKMQSANELSSHSHKGSIANDISSITKDLYNEIPTPALVFGLAGTLPYLGTAFGTIFLSREAYLTRIGADTLTGMDAESALQALHLVEHVQITYGAIILSFLGAIHWGMEFSRFQGTFGYSRLALGVIPVLYAWPTTFLAHGTALVAQWFGFTGTWLLDQKASTNGWTPKWYSSYRFYLSMVVGISIMATFAGTNYYGAGAGAPSDLKTPRSLASTESSTMKRLDKVGEKNRPTADSKIKTGKVEGTVKGDFALEEGDESYGKLRNVKAEEEAKKKEEEEKKQKEKEKKEGKKDKKDEGKKDDGKKDEGKVEKK